MVFSNMTKRLGWDDMMDPGSNYQNVRLDYLRPDELSLDAARRAAETEARCTTTVIDKQFLFSQLLLVVMLFRLSADVQ